MRAKENHIEHPRFTETSDGVVLAQVVSSDWKTMIGKHSMRPDVTRRGDSKDRILTCTEVDAHESDDCVYDSHCDSSQEGELCGLWCDQSTEVVQNVDKVVNFCSYWGDNINALERVVPDYMANLVRDLCNCVQYLRTLQQPIPTEGACFSDTKQYDEWYTFRSLALYVLSSNVTKKLSNYIKTTMHLAYTNPGVSNIYTKMLELCTAWNELQQDFEVTIREQINQYHHFYVYCKI